VQAAPAPTVRLILNTALLLTILGLVVRASGALKEIFFARAFGVSAETDAFVLAMTYATFLPTVLGGAVATALVVERSQANASSENDLSAVMRWVLLAACLCALMVYALAGAAMSTLFHLKGEALERGTSYARVMAPLGFFMVVALALSGVLNAAKQFYVAGISALATPVCTMLGIIFFAASLGVEAAAWGMVVGALIEVFILSWRIVLQGPLFFGVVGAGNSYARRALFWRSVGMLAFASAVASVSPIIDQIFLARLEIGAITNLNYASKVNSLLIGLLGTAFGAAIYPYLSDLAAQRDIAGLKRLTWRLAAVVVPISALTSLAVYVFSHEIVRLLFGRGNFTAAAVLEVAAIQQVFAIQLVFYVAGLLAMRVLNAAGAARIILLISCIGVVSNAFFDWLLYEALGARGIALASVLTSLVSLVVSVMLIKPALAART
jgi:putative peptidoglycan lipid II flippase